MAYIYHDEVSGGDYVRTDPNNNVGYIYNNPLTGDRELRDPNGEVKAIQSGNGWKDPIALECTSPF